MPRSNDQVPAPDLALSLHGYPTAVRGGQPLPLRLKGALALLTYLHLQRGAVGREVLASLLWPDSPASLARGRLRRLVHEMHGALGTTLLEGDSDRLAMVAGVTSDWEATRRAITALAQRPGVDAERLAPLTAPHAAHLLDGFVLGASGFDDWLDGERRAHTAALARALETGAERALAQRDAALAEQAAAALLRLDACSEPGHTARLQARALRGDAAGVEAAYFDCAQALRDEFGVAPSSAIEAAYAQAQARLGEAQARIAYAPTSHGEVAYAAWGRGRETVVVMWGLVSNLEVALEEPRARAFLDRLSRRCRVVMLDRRGSGLSERVGIEPSADTAVEDIAATLRHLGIERAWLFGSSAGGTLAIDFALRHPERVSGLLLFGTSATGRWQRDWPWALRAEAFDSWVASMTDPDRYDDSLRQMAPSVADDPAVRAWYARLLRQGATRFGMAAMLRAYQQMDLRRELHRLRVPTLVMQRSGDRIVPFEAGLQLARSIPGAQFVALRGDDHFLWRGDDRFVQQAVEQFIATAGQPLTETAAVKAA